MGTPWAEDQAWPADCREHTTKLSKYLQTALSFTDSANEQPIDARGVKGSFTAALSPIVEI